MTDPNYNKFLPSTNLSKSYQVTKQARQPTTKLIFMKKKKAKQQILGGERERGKKWIISPYSGE